MGCGLALLLPGHACPGLTRARSRCSQPLPSCSLTPMAQTLACTQVMRAVRRRSLPMVVDADGLWLVNQEPSLVAGGLRRPCGLPRGRRFGTVAAAGGLLEARWLPSCTPQPWLPHCPSPALSSRSVGYANAVLTPNKVEFQRLADKLRVPADAPDALQRMCQR